MRPLPTTGAIVDLSKRAAAIVCGALWGLLALLGVSGVQTQARGVEVAHALPASSNAAAPGIASVSARAVPFVVVIDAGHQSRRDTRMEPIGPGSSTKKAAVTSGTRGTATRIPEYKTNLRVALKLRDLLVRNGVSVIMVRTGNDVDITNNMRARVANAAHADLFIRLHCDGSDDSGVHGISVLTPGKNRWTAPIVSTSMSAARSVSAATIASTHAKNRGIARRSDLAGFNWCKVPVVLVEMGFMSNRAEDKLLASGAYQDKLAAGLARGAAKYLASK